MTDHLALDRDRCLSSLAYEVSAMLGIPPMASTATIEHIFQALVEYFYQNGNLYLPNLGWIVFDDGEAIFDPCDAFLSTLKDIEKALLSRSFSFAAIEMELEAARRANAEND